MAKKSKYTLKRTFGKRKMKGKVVDAAPGGTSGVRIRRAAYTFQSAYKSKATWKTPKRKTDTLDRPKTMESKPEPRPKAKPKTKPKTKPEKPDYDSMSYRELQAEASKNGLKSVGVKKVDLLEQLKSI